MLGSEADAVISEQPNKKNSPSQKIVALSTQLSNWQKDILKKLYKNETISGDDIINYKKSIKKRYDIPVQEGDIILEELSVDEMPDSTVEDIDVKLKSIHNVSRVNSLSDEQNIELANSGLTVLYGENGSGKTGYSRLIKKICKARGADNLKVLPNVFLSGFTKNNNFSAKIKIDVNSVEEEIDWTPETSNNNLNKIRIFDNDISNIHSSGLEHSIAPIPFNFDVFDYLIEQIQKVEASVLGEKLELLERYVTTNQKFFSEEYPIANNFIKTLEKCTEDEVINATNWSNDKEKDFLSLREVVLSPEKAIDLLNTQIKKVDYLLDNLKKLYLVFNHKNKDTLLKLNEDLKSGRDAIKLLEDELNKNVPLSNIGSDPWRALWESAKRFAEINNLSDFPNSDGYCVFCMQKLNEEASSRLNTFNNFVSSDLFQQIKSTEEQINMTAKIAVSLENVVNLDYSLFLDALSEELKQKIINNIDLIKEVIQEIKSTNNYAGNCVISFSSLKALLKTKKNLVSDVKKLKERGVEESLIAAYNQLLLNKVLSENKSKIDDIYKYLRIIKSFDGVLSNEFKTRPITNIKKKLTDEFIDDEFNSILSKELSEMRFNYDVKLKFPKGNKQKVCIDGVSSEVNLGDFLSEGERKALSLACFFAEAVYLKGKTPLVLDDPICSLDHKFKEKVVNRISKFAHERQVILFTHDISFLVWLRDKVENTKIITIRKFNDKSGLVINEEPTSSKNFKTRKNEFEQNILILRKLAKEDKQQEFDEMASELVVDLRRLCEKCIEDVLFGGTVKRLQREVKTQSLKTSALPRNLCKKVDELMTWASSCLDGAHDVAEGDNPTTISLDDIEGNFNKIKEMERETTTLASAV